MDAMVALIREHDVKPNEIARMRCRAGSNILKPLRYPGAENALQAKFCIPFMLSAIALRRRAGIHEFTDDFVQSEPVQALMARVEVVRDEALERQGFEKMRSVVEVELVDGTHYEQASGEYRGGPDNPLSRDELLVKFTECAQPVLPEGSIERAVELIEGIEAVPAVAELVDALTLPVVEAR
jgi:2-methylcitrate dehydratase PrpD